MNAPDSHTSDSTEESTADQHSEQPLLAHLVDLRDCLLRIVLCVLLMFCPLFFFANEIYAFVSEPLRAVLPEGASMIATQVASPFLTPFKLTLVASVFLSMPFILYQMWKFIAPALYTHEKHLAIPLLISSIILFYMGIAFAYFVVFPLAFAFFAGSGPEGVSMMTDITSYLDFVLKLFFAFGIAFEIPIATVLLVKSGMTTTASLIEKRPYIVVSCFVVGMLLTPPDIISQSLLALPMWVLFEIGIIFSKMIEAGRESESEAT